MCTIATQLPHGQKPDVVTGNMMNYFPNCILKYTMDFNSMEWQHVTILQVHISHKRPPHLQGYLDAICR